MLDLLTIDYCANKTQEHVVGRIKHRKEDSNKAIDASGRKIEKAIRGLAKETGQVIPKPQAKADFVIKGIGMRRGEEVKRR